ncbi:MAG: LuxR family maltose regulon positive regulatory protein [Janthinobacterium sp.]
MLAQKPEHLQQFILQTSILDRFCIASCNAVTGRDDGKQLLDEVQRSNMFITPIDEQRLWFRYHPLFAAFLRAQLTLRHPGLACLLHRRAAHWYLEQDKPIAALDHAAAAGDDQLLLALLDQKAEALLLQGRVRLLARWFDRLPRASLLAHSKLTFVYGAVLIHTNRSADALALLQFGNAGAAAPMSSPAALVLRAFGLVMLDRVEEMAALWRDPDLLAYDGGEPYLQPLLMIACVYYCANVGRFLEARQVLDRVARHEPSARTLIKGAVAGYMNSMLDMLQGNFRSAAARMCLLIGDQAPTGGARYGADSFFASIYLAEIRYETGALDEARQLLQMALPQVKEAGIPDHLITSHVIYARIMRAENHVNDALQTLFDMEQLGMQRGLARVVGMARIERARGAILDGNLVAAREMLALVGSAPVRAHADFQPITDDIDSVMLARWRLDIHDGRAATVVPLLKAHLEDACGRGRVRYALRTRVLYALAQATAGHGDDAQRTIIEALQGSVAEEGIRIFQDEGPALLALITQYLESMRGAGNATLHRFAEKILGSEQPGAAMNNCQNGRSHSAGSGEVTERERDVLRLLVNGDGNRTIAEKLFVSVTTVRTHLRNINLKLDAHNRTEAIAIARKRGIIS